MTLVVFALVYYHRARDRRAGLPNGTPIAFDDREWARATDISEEHLESAFFVLDSWAPDPRNLPFSDVRDREVSDVTDALRDLAGSSKHRCPG
ncbi:MAG TPA: hypothetical protein VN238_17745 [Solirubrobacteraceae bacterium]|nr:hypothetical protein [Solirubrobacteraceae bacterium]